MTPTLSGRLQLRIFLMIVVGLPWTLLVTPLLPHGAAPAPGGGVLRGLYATTLGAWLVLLVAGLVIWEPLYHQLQQWRWEKDWPALFLLTVVVPEGVLAWFALRLLGPDVANPTANGLTFTVHLATTWLATWLVAIGPLRVLVPRARFRGGRIVGDWR